MGLEREDIDFKGKLADCPCILPTSSPALSVQLPGTQVSGSQKMPRKSNFRVKFKGLGTSSLFTLGHPFTLCLQGVHRTLSLSTHVTLPASEAQRVGPHLLFSNQKNLPDLLKVGTTLTSLLFLKSTVN